ncbi:hypothetical protein J6590_030713 [Homalodisca vitripennis]|nr:hypothetical protein J6590_030713 [Homalodisca vitripennis]
MVCAGWGTRIAKSLRLLRLHTNYKLISKVCTQDNCKDNEEQRNKGLCWLGGGANGEIKGSFQSKTQSLRELARMSSCRGEHRLRSVIGKKQPLLVIGGLFNLAGAYFGQPFRPLSVRPETSPNFPVLSSTQHKLL